MFVKFSCGCIGFDPQFDNMVVITHDCREGEDTFYWSTSKDYDDKNRVPLTPDEVHEQLDTLSKMWHLGYAMKELNSTLSAAQRILQRPHPVRQGSLPPADTDP